MNQLIVLLLIFGMILIGFSILLLFRLSRKIVVFPFLPLAFALGSTIIVVELIMMKWCHIPWQPLFILFPLIIVAIIALFVYRKNYDITFKIKTLSKIDKLLIGAIIILFLYAVIESQLRPLYAWDALALWLFNAKVFFIDKGFSPSVIHYLESSYPYFMGIVVACFYLLLGYINDKAILLIYPFFYILLGISLFFSLQKKIGTTKALFMTFLLLSTQNFIRQAGRWEAGYSDLPLSFFMFLSILALKDYFEVNKANRLVLLEILLASTSFIKNEGLVFSLFVNMVIVLIIIRRKVLKHFSILLIWTVPCLLWIFYKQTHDFVPELFLSHIAWNIQRIPSIIFYMMKEFFNIGRWNFLWITWLVAFILYVTRKKQQYINQLYLLTILQLLSFAAIYFVSPIPPYLHIPNSFDRLLLQLAPLALYTTSLVIFSKKAV